MKSTALKLLAMSKKVKKISMLCIVGLHDWVLLNPLCKDNGRRCSRCGKTEYGE